MRKWLWSVAAVGAALLLAAMWTPPRAGNSMPPLAPLLAVAGENGQRPEVRLTQPLPGLNEAPMQIGGRAAAGRDGGLRQEWPGFHVTARFDGSEVRVRFDDGINRWRVLLDGGRSGRIELALPERQDLLISGLAPGPHEIRVEKTSESFMPASFGGIFVGKSRATALPAPPAPRPLIEFIGDSDTVGLANGATTRECSEAESFAATDTSRAFGPQLAAELGMDYRMIARSGIGLLRKYGGAAPETTMRLRYAMALPGDPTAARLPQPPADIVVTGLGSNDFGSDLQPGERWSDMSALSRDFAPALIEFLRARARENPGALQVLLAFGEYGAPLVTPYKAAQAALQADGIEATLVVLPDLERTACFWHPSAADHALIARSIISAIRASGR